MTDMLYGFPIAALTVGLTEAIKRTGKLPDQFAPLVAVLVAILLSVGLTLGHGEMTVDAVVFGILYGLAASGLYSGIAAMADGK